MEPSYPQLVVLAYQELPSKPKSSIRAIALPGQSFPDDIVNALEGSSKLLILPKKA